MSTVLGQAMAAIVPPGPHECCGECYMWAAPLGTAIIACSVTPQSAGCGTVSGCGALTGNCTYQQTGDSPGGGNAGKHCGSPYCSRTPPPSTYYKHEYISDNCT